LLCSLFAAMVVCILAFAELEVAGGVWTLPAFIETAVDNIWDEPELALYPTPHFGMTRAAIFYFSADAYFLPSETVSSCVDMNIWGYPGFLYAFDAGLRFKLWYLTLSAQVGLNKLSIYEQEDVLEALFSSTNLVCLPPHVAREVLLPLLERRRILPIPYLSPYGSYFVMPVEQALSL